MHSLVQYMMVKAMVRDRNAERVDYNMMIISLLNINCEYLDVFSHQTITCCSLLDDEDFVDLCFSCDERAGLRIEEGLQRCQQSIAFCF